MVDGIAGGEAVSAAAAVVEDFRGEFRPEEPLADAVKGFVTAKMGGGRAGVVSVEDEGPERTGDNNQREMLV